MIVEASLRLVYCILELCLGDETPWAILRVIQLPSHFSGFSVLFVDSLQVYTR